MINSNEYFDGNVKSLGYSRGEEKSSVGVMEAGEYTFNTGSPEIMTVIEGQMTIQLAGESDWKIYKSGESFSIIGNSSFQVKTDGITSYLCQYK